MPTSKPSPTPLSHGQRYVDEQREAVDGFGRRGNPGTVAPDTETAPTAVENGDKTSEAVGKTVPISGTVRIAHHVDEAILNTTPTRCSWAGAASPLPGRCRRQSRRYGRDRGHLRRTRRTDRGATTSLRSALPTREYSGDSSSGRSPRKSGGGRRTRSLCRNATSESPRGCVAGSDEDRVAPAFAKLHKGGSTPKRPAVVLRTKEGRVA